MDTMLRRSRIERVCSRYCGAAIHACGVGVPRPAHLDGVGVACRKRNSSRTGDLRAGSGYVFPDREVSRPSAEDGEEIVVAVAKAGHEGCVIQIGNIRGSWNPVNLGIYHGLTGVRRHKL